MIGGEDKVISGAPAAGEVAFVMAWLRQRWGSDLVIEEQASECADEVFAWRSRTAFDSWNEDGRTDENDDSMIHVIFGDSSTTIVSARAGRETRDIAARLSTAIASRRRAISTGEPDQDLETMDRAELLITCRALRTAIRQHRDASGHDLCWYAIELWGLLPDKLASLPAVPPRAEFLARCAEYHDSLEPLTPEGVLKKLRGG